MRWLKGTVVIGLIAVGLVGCRGATGSSVPSGSEAAPAGGASSPAEGPSAPPAAPSDPAGGASASTPGASAPKAVTRTAAPAAPVSSTMRAGASAAAAHFYDLYSASQFSALWDLLTPTAKREVSKTAWVGVHDACPGAAAGKSRTIRAVTAFGSAAIITETIAGGTAEDVFNYAGGHWSYSPGEVSIYLHGSIAADIAAAKMTGFCTGSKVF